MAALHEVDLGVATRIVECKWIGACYSVRVEIVEVDAPHRDWNIDGYNARPTNDGTQHCMGADGIGNTPAPVTWLGPVPVGVNAPPGRRDVHLYSLHGED